MTPCGRSCHSLCICAVNSPVSWDGCSCLPSASQTCSIGERSVTWQAMVGCHILEDIVGRVAQNCPHTVTPCEIAVPLDNKCRIGPLAAAPPDKLRWSSALRLNRDSLKTTRLQSYCPRSA
ncbi:hypothetical protein TNCV_292511 [Trichonephila clavipes]|nr:hypothetical protein TNCV_292511 [Trichonephila clavipes]